MNEDHNLRRKFREEADDSLFMDIRFDEQLKERIRTRMQAEEEQERLSGLSRYHTVPQPSGPFHIEPDSQESETADGRRTDRRKMYRRCWAYGLGTVASLVIATVFTFSPWMNGDDTGGTLTAQPGDLMIESTGNAAAGQEGASPLVATETTGTFETMSGDATDSSPAGETTEQILTGLDEAAIWFGEPLPVPSYVPEGYRMELVIAVTEPSEVNEGNQQFEHSGADAGAVRILYVSDSGDSYELTIRKPLTDHTLSAMSGEKVDLNGMTGYWQPGSAGSLHWMAEQFEYQLTGTLDRDEMIRIAASISQ